MKTSKQWLNEVKSDSKKFNNWLSRQLKAEIDAASRIKDLASLAKPQHKIILNKIANDEYKHAELLQQLCDKRGVKVSQDKTSRYYNEVDVKSLTLDKMYAAGYFAEGMRLSRIKAIVEDKDMNGDVVAAFKIILKDEEMHEKAFGVLSSQEAKNSVKSMHDAGVKALGLVI